MALLFLDSFDHYLTAADKYWAAGTGQTTGRHGFGWNTAVRCALNPTSGRMVVGVAVKLGTTFNQLLTLHDVNWHILTVSSNHDGSLEVEMFGGPVVISAADVVRVGQWHYLELDFTVATTLRVVGSDTLYRYELTAARFLVDGAVVLDTPVGPGIETTDTPTGANWNTVRLLPNAFAVIDDLYICDGSGAAPQNAPLGDVQIDVIRPNGPGAVTQWSPVGSPAGWSATNDVTPDDDTTKVVAAAAGVSDLYAMEDINTGNGIIGAQLLISARRTEEGFAALTPLLRHAGVTTELIARSISPTYFYRNRDVFVTMPNGDPLTDANINALQAGFTRTL